MPLPFRINDLLLLMVVFASMAAGILFPGFGSYFQDLPFYCVMVLFSLSYLSISMKSVWLTLKNDAAAILVFVILKSLILPVAIYYLFKIFLPDYAMAALLLTGSSTGAVAPLISNIVRGNSALVLVVVVVTSALVPFVLPALILAVAAKETEISLTAMMRMLLTVIFVPIIIIEVLRRLAPSVLTYVFKLQFPLSLVFFAITNLGIFYRYAPFFHKEPVIIFSSLAIVLVLSVLYSATGILFYWKGTLENQLAGAVMLGNMNNVLIIVFAAQFFGPLEPLVSAMYMIPFFGLIVPLRYYARKRAKPITG